jgi:CheY-like chemotaxis protein
VLVADDEEQVRLITGRILEDAGYSVVTVADGAMAVAAVAADDFDLVVLDAVMPNMTGRAAFDAIRKLKPGAPILFASGYGAEELSARFLSTADAPLLAKPFGPDQLLRAVRALLDSSR